MHALVGPLLVLTLIGQIFIARSLWRLTKLRRAEAKMLGTVPGHVHDCDARAAVFTNVYPTVNGVVQDEGALPVEAYTRVLWACRTCEFRFVQKLDGKWKLDEVQRRRQREEGFAAPWDEGIPTA